MNFKCDLSWLRSGANPYSVWEQRCNVQCGSVHSLRRRPPPGEAAGGAAVVISVWSAVLRNDRFQLVDKRRELLGEAILLPLWLQGWERCHVVSTAHLWWYLLEFITVSEAITEVIWLDLLHLIQDCNTEQIVHCRIRTIWNCSDYSLNRNAIKWMFLN